MGQKATGVHIRVGALGGIGDTIAAGRVMYFGNIPYVPDDASWTPISRNITSATIVPIGGFEIFVGFTDIGSAFDTGDFKIQPTLPYINAEEDLACSGPESFETGSDVNNPTLPALEAMIAVEDRSTSALHVEASDYDQIQFVGYVGSGSAEGGDNNESILDAIDGEADSEESTDPEDSSPFRHRIEKVFMTNTNADTEAVAIAARSAATAASQFETPSGNPTTQLENLSNPPNANGAGGSGKAPLPRATREALLSHPFEAPANPERTEEFLTTPINAAMTQDLEATRQQLCDVSASLYP